MSLLELLERDHARRTMPGVVIGIVTNNEDPQGMGRVKVRLPHSSDDDESFWARVVTPMAGADRGLYFLPEVDDEVLVAFAHGDVRFPYILGALWNGTDSPPTTNDDGKNNLRLIKSRSGHIIKLNDKDGNETIEIVDMSGNNSIVFDTGANTIGITADADITLSAPQGTIKLDAQNLEFTSSADCRIKAGGGMKAEASGTMDVKGATINLN